MVSLVLVLQAHFEKFLYLSLILIGICLRKKENTISNLALHVVLQRLRKYIECFGCFKIVGFVVYELAAVPQSPRARL